MAPQTFVLEPPGLQCTPNRLDTLGLYPMSKLPLLPARLAFELSGQIVDGSFRFSGQALGAQADFLDWATVREASQSRLRVRVNGAF